MPVYDPTTALLIVDVQNDFADPGGSLYVKGGEEVVPLINREIDLARAAGATVLFTQDWHPASTPHFAKDGGVWPVHCVRETWGSDFHPDLVSGIGPVVRKGSNGEDGYSGFTMRDATTGEEIPTPLADLLSDNAATQLVVCGLATDYCVKSTVLDARAKGYPTTVLQNAIRAVDVQAGDGEKAIEEMLAAGALLESRATLGGRAGVSTASPDDGR
ncbi:MAG: isochorismatase family protein [Candidatus Limnocylindrales bacterium]